MLQQLQMREAIFLSAALVVVALFIGTLGYHVCERMSWLDSFSNASMILSGMGPYGPLQHIAGKLFASFYALFSGLLFISIIAVIMSSTLQNIFAQQITTSAQPQRHRRF